MRFGKKTRNLAAAGRRFFGDRTGESSTPSALADAPEPADNAQEEMAMTPPPPEESMVAGDPTQRLLTALGRFHRQVTRAEEGAPQDVWCDECMHQLIAGIEIALNESWADVKEALTDTARILQTYEDANMASDCVPFLKDSYEILCLMVGDLIVDNVRSGVMKKWHERYERALDELANLGLTLVDDESTRDRESHQETLQDSEQHGLDTPNPFDDESEMAGGSPDSVDEGDAFDAMINGNGAASDAAARAEDAEVDNEPFAPVTESGSPFGEPPEAIGERDMGVMPSLDDFLEEEPAGESAPNLDLTNDFTADGPAEIAADTPADRMEEQDGIGENPFSGEDEERIAQEETPFESPAAAEEPAEVAAISETPLAGEPETLELDLETESSAGPGPEAIAESTPEPPEAATPPAPEPEAEPEPGSPQALLKTAQEAMASGNVAGAKLFALQLAANMARLEADQVNARAEAIKADIDANIEAVAAAERRVRDAEERLQLLEEQITQFQQDFDGKREQVQQVREEVDAVESSVADLERQIAELEARRDEEKARLAERQTQLDDNVSEESRMQAELDALQEEEGGARENLDSARDRVRELQESGGAREAELEAARNELAERQRAVEDIEKTIGHVGGVKEDPADEADGDNGDADATTDHGAAGGGNQDENGGE